MEKTPITLLHGRAHLELFPMFWMEPRYGERLDQARDALAALWRVHPCICAITVGWGTPAIVVEVAIPADGSLDLPALYRALKEAVERGRKVVAKPEPVAE